MLAFLRSIARLFLPSEKSEDWRELNSFWSHVLEADRAHMDNLTRPSVRRDRKYPEAAPFEGGAGRPPVKRGPAGASDHAA